MKCVNVIRDKTGNPIKYVIKEEKAERVIEKDIIKKYILSGGTIENLKLTSNNRLIFNEENKITLYHGSINRYIKLNSNGGNDKHDYGKGFYLTPDIELAKEWAVCSSDKNGYVHTYNLKTKGLRVLDFQKYSVLHWIAELMSHREADNSMGYRRNSQIFISKFKLDASGYDVIKGWRADASYFFIAKQFVRNNISSDILEELLKTGSLGIQYCLKSKKAFEQITEDKERLCEVDVKKYKIKYEARDRGARNKMRDIVESDRNSYDNRFIDIIKS